MEVMRIYINLKNKEKLVFQEQEIDTNRIDENYKCSIVNSRLFILKCTNGDFMINPHDISYIFLESDQPLEPDQVK